MPNPIDYTLDEWLRLNGTKTGTFTINGVTYTDMSEVEWRRANDEWLSDMDEPRGGRHGLRPNADRA